MAQTRDLIPLRQVFPNAVVHSTQTSGRRGDTPQHVALSDGEGGEHLGLSDKGAAEAERAPDKEVKEADRAAGKAAKAQEPKSQAKPDGGQ